MASLRLQWTWIVELCRALEEHLLNAHAYYQVCGSCTSSISRVLNKTKIPQLGREITESSSYIVCSFTLKLKR